MALILFFGDTITNKFRSAKKREDDKKKLKQNWDTKEGEKVQWIIKFYIEVRCSV